MEVNTINPKLQEEEISKILDKIAFDCPHCYKEINETHLDEKGRYFQQIKEKIRKVTEEEINFQKSIQKKQLLEQIKVERSYEEFGEVIAKNQTIEELTKAKKKLEEENLAVKLKSQEDLAKATSYDEIRKLEGFRELEKRVEKYQKENEELKLGNQPGIQTLKKTIKELEENLAKEKLETEKARSSEEVEKLERVKELKGQLDKSQKEKEEKEKQLSELKSSEYIENLDRVQKLVEKVDKLENENQLLREHSRVNSKKKGELFEQYVSEELNWVFDNNKDKISKLTQTAKKADFLQKVLTESDKLAGRIIYEAKDTEKWDNEWIKKLERDMVEYEADFGIIVATCENGEKPRRTDHRKRIYVTDENNFINIAKALRHILIQRQIYLEKTSSDSQEQKIKNFEEWISNKLPHFLSRLEKELDDLNKNATSINRVAKNLADLENNIRKIILEEIRVELNNLII